MHQMISCKNCRGGTTVAVAAFSGKFVDNNNRTNHNIGHLYFRATRRICDLFYGNGPARWGSDKHCLDTWGMLLSKDHLRHLKRFSHIKMLVKYLQHTSERHCQELHTRRASIYQHLCQKTKKNRFPFPMLLR